jgi:hypothetical protein
MARVSPNGYYCCSGDETGLVRIWATNNVIFFFIFRMVIFILNKRQNFKN